MYGGVVCTLPLSGSMCGLVQGVWVCQIQVRGMCILCRARVCGRNIIWKGQSVYCVHAVSRLSRGRSVITYNTCIHIYIVGCMCAVGMLSVSGSVVCMLYEVCIPWACYGQVGNAYVYVWSVSVLSML